MWLMHTSALSTLKTTRIAQNALGTAQHCSALSKFSILFTLPGAFDAAQYSGFSGCFWNAGMLRHWEHWDIRDAEDAGDVKTRALGTLSNDENAAGRRSKLQTFSTLLTLLDVQDAEDDQDPKYADEALDETCLTLRMLSMLGCSWDSPRKLQVS